MDEETTLAEWRQKILNSEAMDPVLGLININKRVRIRFVYKSDGSEFDENSSVAEFKSYANVGEASIVIDDGDGGVKIREPETA